MCFEIAKANDIYRHCRAIGDVVARYSDNMLKPELSSGRYNPLPKDKNIQKGRRGYELLHRLIMCKLMQNLYFIRRYSFEINQPSFRYIPKYKTAESKCYKMQALSKRGGK